LTKGIDEESVVLMPPFGFQKPEVLITQAVHMKVAGNTAYLHKMTRVLRCNSSIDTNDGLEGPSSCLSHCLHPIVSKSKGPFHAPDYVMDIRGAIDGNGNVVHPQFNEQFGVFGQKKPIGVEIQAEALFLNIGDEGYQVWMKQGLAPGYGDAGTQFTYIIDHGLEFSKVEFPIPVSPSAYSLTGLSQNPTHLALEITAPG
jgi:hypothetical protein